MKVVIIGAGLGGLACAIACRREGLDVVVLERAPELQRVRYPTSLLTLVALRQQNASAEVKRW